MIRRRAQAVFKIKGISYESTTSELESKVIHGISRPFADLAKYAHKSPYYAIMWLLRFIKKSLWSAMVWLIRFLLTHVRS